MSKSKQEEALQFLDDLDSLSPADSAAPVQQNAPTAATAAAVPQPEGEAEVLAFLDEMTQKSAETKHLERPISRAGTPTLRKSTERVKLGASGSSGLLQSSSSRSDLHKSYITPSPSSTATAAPSPAAPTASQPQAGWGWGNVWSSASAAIQQAKSAVDEQVKYLPKNEQARKWGEGVMEYAKSAQLDKLGQDFKRVGLSTLTDLLNVVAPPISEHEVIQVWLSHDMRGYDGIESLVYRALARIMEQVEGGDLIVNRGDESRPKDSATGGRDLNAVEGYEAAFKLAQANLDEIVKNKQVATTTPESTTSPTTYSHVYLRIQPVLVPFALPVQAPPSSTEQAAVITPETSQTQLQFILYLSDPAHQLVHTTVTQAVPERWLAVWDKYEWVEDLVAEALRVGVEVIGQEYVVSRMSWDMKYEEVTEAVKDEKSGGGGSSEGDDIVLVESSNEKTSA